MTKIGKLFFAVLCEIWEQKVLICVLTLLTFSYVYFIDMVEPFSMIGVFAVGILAAKAFDSLVNNNFYDIESSCGLNSHEYISVRLFVYVTIQAVIQFFMRNRAIKGVTVFFAVPITAFVVLMVIIATMLFKSVFLSVALLVPLISVINNHAKKCTFEQAIIFAIVLCLLSAIEYFAAVSVLNRRTII